MSKVIPSLDGSGIRGVLATQFLDKVSDKLSKPMIVKSGDHPDLLSSQVADTPSAAPAYFATHEIEIPAGSDKDYCAGFSPKRSMN